MGGGADAEEMKTLLASCQGHMSMFQRGVGEGERRREGEVVCETVTEDHSKTAATGSARERSHGITGWRSNHASVRKNRSMLLLSVTNLAVSVRFSADVEPTVHEGPAAPQ